MAGSTASVTRAPADSRRRATTRACSLIAGTETSSVTSSRRSRTSGGPPGASPAAAPPDDASAPNTRAASPAERAMMPTVSSDRANGNTPSVLSTPNVDLNPTTPQNAAGRSTDPAVWVPSAAGTMPQATPAADPELDPPGVRPARHGLTVGAGSAPANAVVAVFPAMTAPASRSRATTAASCSGTNPPNSGDPIPVARPQ